MVSKAQRHLVAVAPRSLTKKKKSVLATETHIHPLKPDQRFLPIVKLKPSMLKVALRHFLNPAFLELSSDMFSSWLGPSARGEKDSSGGKACSERGRQRSEWIISEGSHKVDISCRKLIPSVKIPLELIIQPVSLLPAFLTLKRINTQMRDASLSLFPSRSHCDPSHCWTVHDYRLSLSHSLSHSLTQFTLSAKHIYIHWSESVIHSDVYYLMHSRVPSSNLCGYCTCVCVCVQAHTGKCYCKRATFL